MTLCLDGKKTRKLNSASPLSCYSSGTKKKLPSSLVVHVAELRETYSANGWKLPTSWLLIWL